MNKLEYQNKLEKNQEAYMQLRLGNHWSHIPSEAQVAAWAKEAPKDELLHHLLGWRDAYMMGVGISDDTKELYAYLSKLIALVEGILIGRSVGREEASKSVVKRFVENLQRD